MLVGSAAHAGIEQRLKYERNPYTCADQYLREALEGKAPGRDFKEKEYDDKRLLMINCIKNFEENFHKSLANTLTDPLNQVEVKLEIPFRKGILVGTLDILIPGIAADWKTGAKIPSPFTLRTNPQSGIYWKLVKESGIEPFQEFVYVYLNGKNMNMYQTAKGVWRADSKNPKPKFSFPVTPTEESVNALFNDYVIPNAKQMEQGIYAKSPSEYNCNSCLYRTACWSGNYPLPEVID